MLNDFTCGCPVYLACGYTDLRRGIDGLAGLVQQQFHLNPYQRALFLFCGRRKDRIKGLYWEEDGFLLVYKRLEAGRFQWPRDGEEAKRITAQQYRWLMEGLEIEQRKEELDGQLSLLFNEAEVYAHSAARPCEKLAKRFGKHWCLSRPKPRCARISEILRARKEGSDQELHVVVPHRRGHGTPHCAL